MSELIKNVKDLEKVLKICRNLGVSQIKISEVHVYFVGEQQTLQPKPGKAMIREAQETEQLSLLKAEADAAQEDIETSHVEDPVRYEEAIAQGLLNDGPTRSTDDGTGREETLNH